MTTTFSATLEFLKDPPETVKGTTTAPSVASCFRNAAKQLLKAHPGRKWASCVIVLERD